MKRLFLLVIFNFILFCGSLQSQILIYSEKPNYYVMTNNKFNSDKSNNTLGARLAYYKDKFGYRELNTLFKCIEDGTSTEYIDNLRSLGFDYKADVANAITWRINIDTYSFIHENVLYVLTYIPKDNSKPENFYPKMMLYSYFNNWNFGTINSESIVCGYQNNHSNIQLLPRNSGTEIENYGIGTKTYIEKLPNGNVLIGYSADVNFKERNRFGRTFYLMLRYEGNEKYSVFYVEYDERQEFIQRESKITVKKENNCVILLAGRESIIFDFNKIGTSAYVTYKK